LAHLAAFFAALTYFFERGFAFFAAILAFFAAFLAAFLAAFFAAFA
jgi:hypothetical protein